MLDNLFFIIFPYAAITLAIVITVQRYLKRGFTYSRVFFWGGYVGWYEGVVEMM